MSAELLERMGNLEKEFEKVGNAVKTGIAWHRQNPEGGTFSYLEEEDPDEPPIMTTKLRKTRRKLSLPKGYKRPFRSFGEFLQKGYREQSVFEGLYKQSLDYLKKANAINTLDSESAGMLVLPEFAPKIMELLYDNDLFGRTDQYTINGNRMEFPKLQETSRADGSRTGGLQGYWLEEGDPAVGTRPRLGSTELKLKKAVVVVYLTQEMIDDNGYALEQWVRRAIGRELNFMMGDAIVNGAGAGRPLGFLQSPALVQVAAEGGQAADTIMAMNILKMFSRRRSSVPVSDYVWLINQNVEPQLYSMSMPAGHQQVVYLPPTGLSGSMYATLMGLPVLATEFNPVLGDVGDICLANLKNYLTISKLGISEQVSPHVEFLRDQLAIKFTFRMDGRPLYDAPTVPYRSNGADSQSDFIALAAR